LGQLNRNARRFDERYSVPDERSERRIRKRYYDGDDDYNDDRYNQREGSDEDEDYSYKRPKRTQKKK
jgi:hypothetical protein